MVIYRSCYTGFLFFQIAEKQLKLNKIENSLVHKTAKIMAGTPFRKGYMHSNKFHWSGLYWVTNAESARVEGAQNYLTGQD